MTLQEQEENILIVFQGKLFHRLFVSVIERSQSVVFREPKYILK